MMLVYNSCQKIYSGVVVLAGVNGGGFVVCKRSYAFVRLVYPEHILPPQLHEVPTRSLETIVP